MNKKPAPLVAERVLIEHLRNDPRNSRVHSDRNIGAISASLRRFGQQKPIVANRDGLVVAGNGTLEAARRLGWTEIDVVRTQLSGAELEAYGIADNHAGDGADYDTEMLERVLHEIGPELRDVVGFDFKIAGITPRRKQEAPEEFERFDDDIATDHKCPCCAYEWSGKTNAKPGAPNE